MDFIILYQLHVSECGTLFLSHTSSEFRSGVEGKVCIFRDSEVAPCVVNAEAMECSAGFLPLAFRIHTNACGTPLMTAKSFVVCLIADAM